MTNQINQASVFLPVLAVVALSIVAFVRMAVARTRAVKEQPRDPAYYRAFIGEPEPEYAVVAVRHYGNLLEAPLLFYAGCLSAYVMHGVTFWILVWAWAFTVARWCQSLVHLTYNNPTHRGVCFSLGWLFILALWISVGLTVLALL